MDNLILQETKYTPSILMNAQTGVIKIKGKSYPENTFEFYQPILEWIENYFNTQACDTTVVEMEILYFNSSSSKVFFQIFDMLESAANENSITIHWFYDGDNDSAKEAGEDFIEDFPTLRIELVAK